MYRRLREETCIRTGVDSHADYVAFYETFVGLIEMGALGGARFAGTKPGARVIRPRRRTEAGPSPGATEGPAAYPPRALTGPDPMPIFRPPKRPRRAL